MQLLVFQKVSTDGKQHVELLLGIFGMMQFFQCQRIKRLCFFFTFILILTEDMFNSFRETRWAGGERQKGRQALIGCLPFTSQLGIEPTTLACALTGNRIRNHLVYQRMLQPTEQPGQGRVELLDESKTLVSSF